MDESHPRAHTDPVSGCKPEVKPRAPTKQTRTLKGETERRQLETKGEELRRGTRSGGLSWFCSDGGGGRGCAPCQAPMACSGASHWPASTLHRSRRAHFDTRTSVFGCLTLLPPHFVLSHLVASWGELLGKLSYRFLWYLESEGGEEGYGGDGLVVLFLRQWLYSVSCRIRVTGFAMVFLWCNCRRNVESWFFVEFWGWLRRGSRRIGVLFLWQCWYSVSCWIVLGWFFFGVIVVKTWSSEFFFDVSFGFWSSECGEAEGVDSVAVLVLCFVQN